MGIFFMLMEGCWQLCSFQLLNLKKKMKSTAKITESIERFQQVFWDKRHTDRPPVAIAPNDIWLPIKYLHNEFMASEVSYEDINSDLIMTDYDFAFTDKPVNCDDMIPYCAPWRAIPWLEAMCGCSVKYALGSLAPIHWVKSAKDLCNVELPQTTEWFDCMQSQLKEMSTSLPVDCWISPTILRGTSDVIAAMRGLTEFYCDLMDDPLALDKTAAKINKLFLDVLDIHFDLVSPKMGGYGHIFGYWAPEKTIVIQEDVMGMCSPNQYRDIFMKYNADIVQHLGQCVLFHLHSTGYKHYKDVLEVPGIAGLEITVEINGPSLMDMLPDLQDIMERSRLILHVDHYFEQLPVVLENLPKTGLYLIINDDFIDTEKDFIRFVKGAFGKL